VAGLSSAGRLRAERVIGQSSASFELAARCFVRFRRLAFVRMEPYETERLSRVVRMAADSAARIDLSRHDLSMKARIAETGHQQAMLAGAKESLANLSPLATRAALANASLHGPKPVAMPKIPSQGEIMRRALSPTNERLDVVAERLDTLTLVVSQLAEAGVSNSEP
jgi:hypothetical protein